MTNETNPAAGAPLERQVRPHDTKLQPRPVCPHCGYKHDDAWEWNFGPGLDGSSDGRACYHCEGEFDCERVVDVSYTTKPAEPRKVTTAAELRQQAKSDTSCVGAFARARPGA